MFKEIDVSPKYLFTLVSLRRLINISNIDQLTKEQIEHIGKPFDQKLFYIYKKNLLSSYDKHNKKFTLNYIYSLKKLIAKLDINLYNYELDYIESLYSKEFSTKRACKRLEVPFSWGDRYEHEYAYFAYKHLKIYYLSSKGWLKFKKNVDIYLMREEIILYSHEDKEIYRIIDINDVKNIVQKNYGIRLIVEDNEEIFIRYKDLDVLMISLYRIYKRKYKEIFNEFNLAQDKTIETTIQTNIFLDDKRIKIEKK